ncbi:helix-turn-helix transcriptional regulator, partial [Streptococcus suis]
MEFSERLKELRLKAKMTQIEVAEKVGVSQPQYARWEAGKRKPTSETLQ